MTSSTVTDKPIHVAMISHGYYPLIGGAERQLAAVSPALQDINVKVSVITRRFDDLAPFETINGVDVYRVPIPGPKPTASLSFTYYGLKQIKALQPDIVHAHELFSATTTAISAKRRHGMPIVVTAHRSGPIGDVQRLQQKLFGHRRLATFAKEVDQFVTISREIDEELMGIGVPQENLTFVPNAVNTDRFQPPAPEQKAALREQFDIPKEAPVAIFVGRLAPEKRVNYLVDAWRAVQAIHPQAVLLILGIGPEEASLKQRAGTGVRFLGSIDDVVPYLQAADLFVLPSVAEGLSVAMLEAMSTGLTAMVTAVGGAPETITHGENGWLLTPDEAQEVEDSLINLLGDKEQLRTIGYNARQTILQEFALTSIAKKLRELYEKLLAQAAQR